MRVNLGCGHVRLEGYVNVDLYADEADIKADVLAVTFEHVDELVAYHLLEHLTHSDAAFLLAKAKAWMRQGGTLEVETPDMEEILNRGPTAPNWPTYIYGGQEHEGELHRWGYTLDTLTKLVADAGWVIDGGERFFSPEGRRLMMPCIAVRAHR